MQDSFTGRETRIRGSAVVGTAGQAALQHDHGRRLEALARLGEAAAQCHLRADSDRDLVLLAEDEVSLLEASGPEWAALGRAIRSLRSLLPLMRLSTFGFAEEEENPLEEANPRMRRIGTGVEAWAFESADDGSVYKFYRPREEKKIGSVFGFNRGSETILRASAGLGDYRGLLEKLLIILELGGMATEVVAVTPEGIIVAKQVRGLPLAQGEDTSSSLPPSLIEIPSRFLRADRDHPRLLFMGGQPFLVADLHARNFVQCIDGALRVIDLVAGPWPPDGGLSGPAVSDWIVRVKSDPDATALPGARDEDL